MNVSPVLFLQKQSHTLHNPTNSDQSKYMGGNLPGPDSVLYIGDLTAKGDNKVIMVNAAANKNNKALDVVVGDAWLVVEGQS